MTRTPEGYDPNAPLSPDDASLVYVPLDIPSSNTEEGQRQAAHGGIPTRIQHVTTVISGEA
jgi:hypothetical protein